MSQSIISDKLRREVISTFPLGPKSIHGPAHWIRVAENARRVGEETGADIRVLELFALFHDSLRKTEIVDNGHGARGAAYAVDLRRKGWFTLDAESMGLFITACEGHTEGLTTGDPTVITCWDADRLDLWRCGIVPDPMKMCTETARRKETIEWAMKRSGGPPDGIVRNVP